MKKKTIVVALMGLMTFTGLILWPRTQDNSYLDAQNIIFTDDTIQLYLTCAESAPKFVYYDVSYDRGIYTITVKSSPFYGKTWRPEGIPIEMSLEGEVKTIELKDNEKTKVIYSA